MDDDSKNVSIASNFTTEGHHATSVPTGTEHEYSAPDPKLHATKPYQQTNGGYYGNNTDYYGNAYDNNGFEKSLARKLPPLTTPRPLSFEQPVNKDSMGRKKANQYSDTRRSSESSNCDRKSTENSAKVKSNCNDANTNAKYYKVPRCVIMCFAGYVIFSLVALCVFAIVCAVVFADLRNEIDDLKKGKYAGTPESSQQSGANNGDGSDDNATTEAATTAVPGYVETMQESLDTLWQNVTALSESLDELNTNVSQSLNDMETRVTAIERDVKFTESDITLHDNRIDALETQVDLLRNP